MKRWVWTTFNSFQWDLNYSNPEVFRAMAEEMLFLANQGIEVLRLDAVAFIWKRLGTNCENQPEAHTIIRVFNVMAKIVAPCLLFKSEAIVHPDEVIRYIHPDECQLSYNPLLMALLWEALATREVKLLEQSMRNRYRTPAGCTWVNYVRCHDDIGWTFDDQDARKIGIDPVGHRKFLNKFASHYFFIVPKEAVEYICRQPKIQSIVFGASSRQHIVETKEMIERYSQRGSRVRGSEVLG